MDYIRPDYNNCLVNLSNSILKHFGVETSAPTLKMADELLEEVIRNGKAPPKGGVSIKQFQPRQVILPELFLYILQPCDKIDIIIQ